MKMMHDTLALLAENMAAYKSYSKSGTFSFIWYPEQKMLSADDNLTTLFSLNWERGDIETFIREHDVAAESAELILRNKPVWLKDLLKNTDSTNKVQFFKRLLIETIENKQLNLGWGLSDCLEYDETQTLITEITNEVGLNQDVSVETELKYAQLFFTLSQTSVYLQKKIIVPSTVPALQLGAAFYFSKPPKEDIEQEVDEDDESFRKRLAEHEEEVRLFPIRFSQHQEVVKNFLKRLCKDENATFYRSDLVSGLGLAHENEITLLKYMVKNADKGVYPILLNDESFKTGVKIKILDPLFKDYEFIESIEGKMFVSNYLKYFDLDDIKDVDKKKALQSITSWILKETDPERLSVFFTNISEAKFSREVFAGVYMSVLKEICTEVTRNSGPACTAENAKSRVLLIDHLTHNQEHLGQGMVELLKAFLDASHQREEYMGPKEGKSEFFTKPLQLQPAPPEWKERLSGWLKRIKPKPAGKRHSL